jgi:hypothetical protein
MLQNLEMIYRKHWLLCTYFVEFLFYKKELLRNMYDKADCYNSSLEDFEAWVSAGCKNAEVKGVDADGEEIVIKAEEVIEKKAWVDSEPPVDQASLIAELQAKITALENA